jgi:hypothetical protein
MRVEPFWSREAIATHPALRGVYDKPFLVEAWRRVYLGGYAELEYQTLMDEVLGVPRGFRLHRTNLFAYGNVSERVRFASEIEFENEEPGEDLEVKLELAMVDWTLANELTLRGGALLAPVGRVNLNHDGPVRELTSRPLVSTFVVPTTLTEAGAGARGTFDLHDEFSLSYEAYAVNGFRLLDRDGTLAGGLDPSEIEQLLREGRPSLGGDVNKTPSTTGRVSALLFRALEVGGSWHAGTYDERDDNVLALLAGDFALVWGPAALEGEVAFAEFERDLFARTAGVPEDFWGYYLQASLNHLPEALKEAVPHVFGGEGATFTLVVRYDYVDIDGDRAEAIEPGLNFRPFADTVLKFSYRFGLRSLGIRDVPGRRRFDDDGFIFSLATYF